MGTSKEKKLELAKRRKKVARLYLQGYPQRVIADEVNMSVGTVNRDISIIQKRWKKSALVDMNEHFERELGRLDSTEQMLFEQLKRSGETKTKTVKKMKEKLARESEISVTEDGSLKKDRVTKDQEPTEREVRTTKIEQKREAHLWRYILDVQKERRKLLGLYDHSPSEEGSRMDALVNTIEETAEETDMRQFEDEEIR